MVRGIRPVLEGGELHQLNACPCRKRPISIQPTLPQINRRVSGQRIDHVSRLAKRALLTFASGDVLVFEPRMTGLLLVEEPPTIEHLRLEIAVGSGPAAASAWFWDRRGLGTVRLLSPTEFESVCGPQRLGPDALQMDVASWRDRLTATRRPIKVALLDQRLVAGIGNLYASEILHRARIHPERRTDRLSPAQLKRLDEATRSVLQLAIRYEGSTLGDGTYRNALNQDGRYQNEHRVYAKAGQRCTSCGRGLIRRIVQAQRSTFFCPCCQR